MIVGRNIMRPVVWSRYIQPKHFSAPSIDTGVNGKAEGFELIIPITVPSVIIRLIVPVGPSFLRFFRIQFSEQQDGEH